MKKLISIIAFSSLALSCFANEGSVNKELKMVGRVTPSDPRVGVVVPPNKQHKTTQVAKFTANLKFQLPDMQWVAHTQDRTYPSKSKVRIHLVAHDTGYLYVYNEDSVGNPIKELIHLSKGNNHFQARETYDLPSKEGFEDFFELGGKGHTRETLYIIYSKAKLNVPSNPSSMANVLDEAKNNSKQYIASASSSINKELQFVPVSLSDMSKSPASSFESKVDCSEDMCQVKIEFSHQ